MLNPQTCQRRLGTLQTLVECISFNSVSLHSINHGRHKHECSAKSDLLTHGPQLHWGLANSHHFTCARLLPTRTASPVQGPGCGRTEEFMARLDLDQGRHDTQAVGKDSYEA